jgi:Spy/CpxP family protein refolding chaperone
MRRPSILLAVAWMALAASAAAAAPAGAPATDASDPIAQNLFPPELIMKHSSELGLDPQQRGAIKEAVQQAQSKFLDAQWEMQEETGKMVRLLQARPVDEKAVLAEVDRVLDLERQIKRTQISLLVRLKNLLTPTQQTRLAELRKAGD